MKTRQKMIISFPILFVTFLCSLTEHGAQAQNVTALISVLQTLPSLLAYWPLTKEIAATDATSEPYIDGTPSLASLNYVTGPFGIAATAIQTSNVTDNYVTFESYQLNFATSSWTIAGFVKSTVGNQPLFAYLYPPTSDGAFLGQVGATNLLTADPNNGEDSNFTIPCNVTGVWQFIALTHDYPNHFLKVFCNDSYSATTLALTLSPNTSSELALGHAMGLTGNAAFACVSAFTSALNSSQLLQAKQLCPFYGGIKCSINCAPGSCRIDVAMATGYSCTCVSGYTGPTCDIPVCSVACQNGGTCIGPETCVCPTDWSGDTCAIRACNSECGICPTQTEFSDLISSTDSLCNALNYDELAECEQMRDEGLCLQNSDFMWTTCQTSCSKYATCECDVPNRYPFDTNCTCGEWAAAGLCETNVDVRNQCLFTCGRRMDPQFLCTPLPQGTDLAPHSHWTLSANPLRCFNGSAAYLQGAIMACDLGFFAEDRLTTGMHVCDPLTPNEATGNWVEVNLNKPNCIPAICEDPPFLAGTYYVNQTSAPHYVIGDIVTCYCNSSSNQAAELQCTFEGSTGWSWVGAALQCTPPPCLAIVDGINAYANVTANETGGAVIYTCFQGYLPTTSLSYFAKTCQPDGTWVPAGVPKCTIATCGPPVLEEYAYLTGTKASGKYVYGDTVTTHCVTGASSVYIQPGTENTPIRSMDNTCLDTGEWTKNVLACLLSQCDAPQSWEVSNYRMINTTATGTFLSGVVIAFQCDWMEGYHSSVNQSSSIATWRCDENGTWVKERLLCTQVALTKSHLSGVTYNTDTAVATATTVLALCSFFLGIIVCLDYVTVSRDIRLVGHNVKHWFKRLRDEERIKILHDVRVRLRNEVKVKDFLAEVEDVTDAEKLAVSGMTAVNDDIIIVDAIEGKDRPKRVLSASARKYSVDLNVADGPMEVPQDVVLRFGLPPGSR